MKENVPQGQENTVISVRASFTGQPLGDRANLVRIVSKLEDKLICDIFYTYLPVSSQSDTLSSFISCLI